MVVTVAAKGKKPPEKTGDNAIAVPGLAVRKAAARLLAAVIDARTPLDGLTDHEHGHPLYRALDMRDRALVRAILLTALRFRRPIERLIARRLERPLPANANVLRHVLHVAAAQILFLDVPDSAAVDLAVTHARSDPRMVRFCGLVNAVLRALIRVRDKALPVELARKDDAPEWFALRLLEAYGLECTNAILGAHRLEAPTDFTVKSNPQYWAEQLGGIVLPTGSVRVEKLANAVSLLPGFTDGAWWVQDAAAALPAHLLGDVEGKEIADLCAAPGGKTAQIAVAGGIVTAVDSSKNRLRRLAANFERLQLPVTIIEADLGTTKPPKLFDAVLLDAPCSSTGTLRRHPDVAWTKSPEDIEKLAAVQRRLLARAVEWLKPGGRLVFSNCSLDPLEGEDLLAGFLAGESRVVADPIQPGEVPGIDPFLTPQGMLRTTPADMTLATPALSGMDGFFAARLRRQDPA